MSEEDTQVKELIAQFKAAKTPEEKWKTPFPMGVFGTLRHGWGNHHLMGNKQSKLVLPVDYEVHDRYNYGYRAHYKAFMPHFVPIGLGLHYKVDSSAAFEVYVYDAENWNKMIPFVDRLEGFHPSEATHRGYGYYHRTLTWMQILPSTYSHPLFERRGSWAEERDLRIALADWKTYPKIPVWVYSSVRENVASAEAKKSPVIWDGVTFDRERF